MRAGFESNICSQIHGDLARWQCGGKPTGKKFPLFESKRCCDEIFPAPEGLSVNPELMELETDGDNLPVPLSCPRNCGGRIRPNVYLFGDGDCFLQNETVTRSETYFKWIEDVKRQVSSEEKSLCIIEIGCGLRVPSIRARGEELLQELGTFYFNHLYQSLSTSLADTNHQN